MISVERKEEKDLEEIRWRIIKNMLDEFPKLIIRVRKYLKKKNLDMCSLERS
ncbi:hypothetical protein J7L60_04700 [Candidatus Bathyarchaeota archaeon]|nr:hypothetical protein [Candidatus Bathyarchaeota archaeon]